jgi:hypothetical protein
MITKIFKFFFKRYYYLKLDIKNSSIDYNKFISLDNSIFEYKELNSNDFGLFFENKFSEQKLEVIKKRLLNFQDFQGFVYVERNTKKIAMIAWINKSKKYFVREFNRFEYYKLNEVLFEDSITWTEYQKKGLYISMLCHQINYSKVNGIETAFAVVYFKNIAPLKTLAKLGFKRIDFKSIYYRKGSITFAFRKLLKLKNEPIH